MKLEELLRMTDSLLRQQRLIASTGNKIAEFYDTLYGSYNQTRIYTIDSRYITVRYYTLLHTAQQLQR